MGHELITGAQIEENMGLATRLHEKRLGGLYVDRFDDAGVSLLSVTHGKLEGPEKR